MWDTLELSVENRSIDSRTLTDTVGLRFTANEITASAMGVKK